jgi:hypothetical protein
MTSDIVAGKAAWGRLKQGSKSWADWVLVGHALLEGRAIAMRNAGTTSPAGRGYSDAFNGWLTYNRHRSVAPGQAAGRDGPSARDRGLARDPDAAAASAHESSGCRSAQLSASDQYQVGSGARQLGCSRLACALTQ